MAAERISQAERFRKARLEFEESLARGVTIPVLREMKLQERRRAADKFERRMHGQPENSSQYWWNRD